MTAGIYTIYCKSNDTHYIGESTQIERRIEVEHCRSLKAGRHHNAFLQRAWDKYGEVDFVFSIVAKIPHECVEILSTDEIGFITKGMEAQIGYAMIEEGFKLFNLRDFCRWGETSPMLTPSIRKKVSQSFSTPTTKAKFSEAAKRARKDPIKARNILSAVNSIQAKEKRSKAAKKDWAKDREKRMRYWTSEARAEQSARMKAILSHPSVALKTAAQIQKRKRQVVCVETGEAFDSLKSAAEFHGVKIQSIFSALSGKSSTCNGYHWKYKLD